MWTFCIIQSGSRMFSVLSHVCLGLCKRRLFSLITFVMDGKVLGHNCDEGDGQTCFGIERFEGEGKGRELL